MAKKTPVGASAETETQDEDKAPGAPLWKPTYQTQVEFDSHLFELKTDKMVKNIHWSKENPELREIDHQHFFHSCDSAGREQIHSTATGGHFHIMTMKMDENGKPVVTCSTPKMHIHKKGKRLVVDVQSFNDPTTGGIKEDKHIHQVIYHRSSKVKPRTVNAEAMKTMDKLETAKEQKIPGIQG